MENKSLSEKYKNLSVKTLKDFIEIREELVEDMLNIEEDDAPHHYIGHFITTINIYYSLVDGDKLKDSDIPLIEKEIKGFYEMRDIFFSKKKKSFITFLKKEFNKKDDKENHIGELNPTKVLEKFKKGINEEREKNKKIVIQIISDKKKQEIINKGNKIREMKEEINKEFNLVNNNKDSIQEVVRIMNSDKDEEEKEKEIAALTENKNEEGTNTTVSHYLNNLTQPIYLGINMVAEGNCKNLVGLERNIEYFIYIYNLLMSNEKDDFIAFLESKNNKNNSGELTVVKVIEEYKELKNTLKNL